MSSSYQILPQVVEAIKSGDVNATRRIILENPEQLHVVTPFAGGNWLHYAAKRSTLDVVKCLTEVGFDVNSRSCDDGDMPIVRAAQSGNYNVVRHLLDHGATMDVSASVRNPLFAAVPGWARDRHPVHGSDTPPENYLKIAELLLDYGIDSTVRYNTDTMKNMDAMAFACMWGRQDIARLIAERQAEGDAGLVETLLLQADRIAEDNTEPVPEGETVRPS